ncbi:MFS transporter [Nocardioides mangrovicus]|uniref:MFS transporter n=1 Tax=Nocardioides mangrovicus TaxID=2478913 RepID=A0A3L8NYH5_9ACTN|nr:MFS transporter [Nocardioides mangrovicus]RLV47924.1 MFS transporter [Nocardioides mangrovicus]
MSRRPLVGYLAAQAVSTTGTRVSMIAVPWFVLTTTGSATRTGLAAFAEMLPMVVCQALSGPLADRLSARRVAITCDALSVLAVGAIPLLHVLGLLHFGALLVLVALAGALRGPGEAAKHAMMPVLVRQTDVPTERLTGLEGAVERTASLAGAGVGAGLVATLGAANAVAVDALSFGLSALLLLGFTRRDPGARPVEARPRLGYVAELRSGWDFMRRDQVLMGIGVMVAVTNLLDAAWSSVLLPVWARDSGHGVAAVGIVLTTFSAAAIVSSTAAATIGHRLPRYWTYLICFVIGGVPRFVVQALHVPLWLVIAVCVVGGLGSGFLNPILGAVLFERTPAELVGRVSAMNIAMAWSLMPLGGVLGGVLVAGIGLSPALLVVGGAYFLTTMLPVVQPRWRELDRRPDQAPSQAPGEVLGQTDDARTSSATKSSLANTGGGMTNG